MPMTQYYKALSCIRTKPRIFSTLLVQWCSPSLKKHFSLICFRFIENLEQLSLTNAHETQLVNILYLELAVNFKGFQRNPHLTLRIRAKAFTFKKNYKLYYRGYLVLAFREML